MPLGIFLSTLSLRRATRRSVKLFRQNYISIHALLAESDAILGIPNQVGTWISIHALLAESDFFARVGVRDAHLFLSTLSLRRATITCCPPMLHVVISIHALLAESDKRRLHRRGPVFGNFYPRSPCGERRFSRSVRMTRPYFYPRSPCGERLQCRQPQPRRPFISIHALLAESDSQCRTLARGMYGFLSTLSLRRATTQ